MKNITNTYQHWDKEEYLNSFPWICVSAVEKSSQDFHQFKDDMSYSPHLQNSISALRSRYSPAHVSRCKRYKKRNTPCFFLSVHKEEWRRWDGKPTSLFEESICELQEKSRGFPKGSAALVPSGQFSRWDRRASDPLEGTFNSYPQEVNNMNPFFDAYKRNLASSKAKRQQEEMFLLEKLVAHTWDRCTLLRVKN